ncbi:Diphthamide biosynthesis protein 2 [Xylographa carneopallida]|nr:Diphthamide biosynthesis protein 2 [Xylographa carneopallida]
MPSLPEAAPVLSTPDTHIFEDPYPSTSTKAPRKSKEQIALIYEIHRTIASIRRGQYRRIALQFPDSMLPDAPRVFEALQQGLKAPAPPQRPNAPDRRTTDQVVDEMLDLQISAQNEKPPVERLYILADTSYGACCVDEIAAEHVEADVVVHYGRACLSATARLPVIYVFTKQQLALEGLLATFRETYPGKGEKVILMADVTYASHLTQIEERLRDEGYANLFTTAIIHNPSSPLPNRTVPEEVSQEEERLKEWRLFHVAEPPQALLLTLSSRVADVHIYPTVQADLPHPQQTLLASTSLALRRRYALLTSLSTVPIFGILINTLSVKNYLHIVEHVKAQILAAGKKSYTFVVGKVNAAKIANFSEVGGWVVISCWESSLVESKDFWKPVITPFELELALKGDGERVWTGEWKSDFQGILDGSLTLNREADEVPRGIGRVNNMDESVDGGELDSEPESAPPEFDLRTGRYISHSRPMRGLDFEQELSSGSKHGPGRPSEALIKRARGDLAVVGGEISPGAEFLRSKRTWKGLGSDFEIAYDEGDAVASTTVEEGRSGIARNYTLGDAADKR